MGDVVGEVGCVDEDEYLAEQAAVDLGVAFPLIVRAHGGAIYTTALRVGLQPADADDLAAETFVRAYAALGGYAPGRIREMRLRPWLVTITLNLWRNQLRDATRRPRLVPLEPLGALPDPTAGPEEVSLAAGTSQRVERLLAGLSPQQRVPIVLRHVVGLSNDETAAALDCPAGTVKSHVSRGLAILRAQLHLTEEASS
ncbi:MAG: RNA polymerase sigma factor [Acidimicrobiales bacterium]